MQSNPALFLSFILLIGMAPGYFGYVAGRYFVSGLKTGRMRNFMIFHNRNSEPISFWLHAIINALSSIFLLGISACLVYIYIYEFIRQGTFPVAPPSIR